MKPKSSGRRQPARCAATNGTAFALSMSGSYAAIARKRQRRPRSPGVAGRIGRLVSFLAIDHFQRHDLVGLAAIDHETNRLRRDEGAVRLAFRIEGIAARP